MSSRAPGGLADPRTWQDLINRMAKQVSDRLIEDITREAGAEIEAATARAGRDLSKTLDDTGSIIERRIDASAAGVAGEIHDAGARAAREIGEGAGAAAGEVTRAVTDGARAIRSETDSLQGAASEIGGHVRDLRHERSLMKSSLEQFGEAMDGVVAAATERLDDAIARRTARLAHLAGGEAVAERIPDTVIGLGSALKKVGRVRGDLGALVTRAATLSASLDVARPRGWTAYFDPWWIRPAAPWADAAEMVHAELGRLQADVDELEDMVATLRRRLDLGGFSEHDDDDDETVARGDSGRARDGSSSRARDGGGERGTDG